MLGVSCSQMVSGYGRIRIGKRGLHESMIAPRDCEDCMNDLKSYSCVSS